MIGRLAAVTGGTGFVGRAVVRALAEAGWRVRLLARRDPAHPLLDGLRFETIRAGLGDPDALDALVRDADLVVHVAGLTKARRARDFLDINRDAAARLAGIAARRAPAARFVLISSQAARAPHLSAYAASKRQGEIATIDARGDTPWTVLRPSVVYGPWDLEGVALLSLARRIAVPVPRAPEPVLAMVHVRDLADAVVRLAAPTAPTGIFEITDSAADGHAWRRIVQLAGGGRGHLHLPVPDAVLIGAGAGGDLVAYATGRPRLFGRGKSREILHRDWRPDPGMRLSPEIWRPGISLEDGFTETLAWWRDWTRGRSKSVRTAPVRDTLSVQLADLGP